MLLRELKIDPEFQELLRQQTPLEAEEMAASIAQLGYLSPLIVWEGHAVICDGMHRWLHWRAAQDAWENQAKDWLGKRPSPEPPRPDFIQKRFADRESVKKFILEHQAARRNLSQNELALLLGKEVRDSVSDGESKKDAIAAVAEKHDVSERTVVRGIELVDAVDTLSELVSAQTGDDLKALVKQEDGPAREQVVEAAKELQ